MVASGSPAMKVVAESVLDFFVSIASDLSGEWESFFLLLPPLAEAEDVLAD